MELRELLSGEVVTIDHDATVAEGAARMQQEGIGSLAVIADDEIYGIFTERDVVRCVATGYDSVDSTIGEWMTPYPDSFSPDMDVREAADWMLAVGYRHLPVVEKNRLIGMTSIKDILWALTSETYV
ncbi:MAG TPA: CBS domain-containing protein [Acidimicrobiia bacterium]|nr:CBS domain-containing protein [Acidimicrobiia bacterium]